MPSAASWVSSSISSGAAHCGKQSYFSPYAEAEISAGSRLEDVDLIGGDGLNLKLGFWVSGLGVNVSPHDSRDHLGGAGEGLRRGHDEGEGASRRFQKLLPLGLPRPQLTRVEPGLRGPAEGGGALLG